MYMRANSIGRDPGIVAAVCLVLAGIFVCTVASPAEAAPYWRTGDGHIFGDSLSCEGNTFLATGGTVPPPPYAGVYSNGPVWPEYFMARLGHPAMGPSLRDGTNFAIAGAETGPGLSPINTPNLGTQITQLAATNPTIGPNDYVIVWGGANPFLNGEPDPRVPVGQIADHLTDLRGMGFQHLMVFNMPPFGETPALRDKPHAALANGWAQMFNEELTDEIHELKTSLNADITILDVHQLFLDVINDPGAYGLTNVTDPAFDKITGTVVPNPDEYLFWDDKHPTTRGHAIVASIVPEPATIALLLVGIAALSLRTRRRAA